MTLIVAAAIKHPCGKITRGRTHVEAIGLPIPGNLDACVDGFLTDTGQFLTRQEADQLAGRHFNSGDLECYD